MREVNLYFKTFCGRLKKCCNQERIFVQQKVIFDEKLNIEYLKKSLSGSPIEKSPNYFITETSRKYDDHIFGMVVSACVSGSVFGDTVYGVQSQERLFYLLGKGFMPRYKYTYINSSGKKDETTIEAMSEDIAVLRLRKMGFYVTSIQREEFQIQQTQKQISPELKQNVATYVKENKPIQYRSNFAPQPKKQSDTAFKTSTIVELTPEVVSQSQLHMLVNYREFGDIYLNIKWEDVKDSTDFWGNVIKRTPEDVLQYVRKHFFYDSLIEVSEAVRTSDINNENRVCVRLRTRLGEFFSATNYEDVHEQLLPEYKKFRCPECASQKLSFTQQSSQSYNAGKGLIGSLVFGTAGALSGFESNSFERIHCMECGKSWYASNNLCELRFDDPYFIKTSLELLKKLYDDCRAEAERKEVSKNYKSALCELATAIYCRLHCQTLLSAKERFNEKIFYTLCGEKLYKELYLILDATELTSKYDAVKKAIVDASFIKNRAWAQKDLGEAIDKLFAAREADSADFIDIKDTFFMFNCPYCGKSYKTSTASKGAYIDCKNCRSTIEIK